MGLSNFHKAVGSSNLPGRSWLAICCVIFISACTTTGDPSPQVLALLENPPKDVQDKQNTLTPLTLEWYKEIESKYISKGRKLTAQETNMARKIGVTNPEQIRVVILKDFPYPANSTLSNKVKQYGLGGSAESGRTMGNIIMLKARFKDERWMLAHQLSYVAQQEKMGRREFVRRFIAERELMGNHRGPMETTANKIALDFK